MRVALLTRRFDPAGGGTERDLMITASYLRANGHDVKIYANEVRSTDPEFPVKGISRPRSSRSLGLLRFAQMAPKIARDDGAELVLSFARTIGADVLRSGGGAHISYVRTARQWRGSISGSSMWLDPYHRMQMRIERKGFRSASLKLAIAVSNLVRDDLIGSFRIGQGRVTTLYNGVDLERFSPLIDPAERREVRRSLGLTEHDPVVIFIGNGFARKGLGFLLKAWPMLRNRAQLLVVGEDRAAIRFRALAKKVGSSRIVFAGPRSDGAALLKAAGMLVLPSLFEPFGNVVMEALASGLPVLVSRQVGAAELLPEAMRPYIVDAPGNTSEIAARLDELIENHHALRGLARATAESHTWDAYGRRLMELLGSL
ncbi:MAG: glycosyltransferase family 4 protein [Candidatus Binataceae bacterium]